MHRGRIEENLGGQAVFAPPAFQHPRAAHLAWLALRRLNEAGSAHELVPEYLQLAEAEAKWLAKARQEGSAKG
jgi:tRNA threonylcarbamoyladenosine biosynthesis protein TsaB